MSFPLPPTAVNLNGYFDHVWVSESKFSGSGDPLLICPISSDSVKVYYDRILNLPKSNSFYYLTVDFYVRNNTYFPISYNVPFVKSVTFNPSYFYDYSLLNLGYIENGQRLSPQCYFNSSARIDRFFTQTLSRVYPDFSEYRPFLSISLFPAVFIAVVFFIFIYKMFKRVLF